MKAAPNPRSLNVREVQYNGRVFQSFHNARIDGENQPPRAMGYVLYNLRLRDQRLERGNTDER